MLTMYMETCVRWAVSHGVEAYCAGMAMLVCLSAWNLILQARIGRL